MLFRFVLIAFFICQNSFARLRIKIPVNKEASLIDMLWNIFYLFVACFVVCIIIVLAMLIMHCVIGLIAAYFQNKSLKKDLKYIELYVLNKMLKLIKEDLEYTGLASFLMLFWAFLCAILGIFIICIDFILYILFYIFNKILKLKKFLYYIILYIIKNKFQSFVVIALSIIVIKLVF